jgi:hypothetical protein
MTTLSLRKSISRSLSRPGLFPVAIALAFVALAIGPSTANGAPGDLIAPSSDGNIVQLPINPSFGTPSLYWDNSNLPQHYWLGIAFDQSGNLYASDAVSETIYKITPDRTTLNVFATGLNGAMGLAVDAAGNIYEADTGSGNVYKFTPQGVQSTFASGLQIGSLYGPTIAMAFDGQGNLSIPSQPQGAIYKITPQGVVNIFVVLPYTPSGGIGFDSSGNLLVTTRRGPILKYPPQGGDPIIFFASPDPRGFELVIDSTDNVFAGGLSATIFKYPSGEEIYIGNGFDAYETLGQLAIQPTLCTANTWATKAPMLQAGVAPSAAIFGGQLYVFDGGGMPTPQVYDPVADSWSFKAADPVVRANTSVGVINNKIYVAEGWINSDSNRATQALEIYDPVANSWTAGKSSQIARGGPASAVINGKLYLTGGSKNGGRVQPKDLMGKMGSEPSIDTP